jgi:hypothetical protein
VHGGCGVENKAFEGDRGSERFFSLCMYACAVRKLIVFLQAQESFHEGVLHKMRLHDGQHGLSNLQNC